MLIFLLRRCCIVIVIVLINLSNCKVFDKCELANILKYKHYFSHEQVNAWVCIAKYQSNLNSGTVNYDSESTGYHGLFQISDLYWCSAYGSGNECSINCAQLRDDDLFDDIACISRIFNEHSRLQGNGYYAWTVYRQYCEYKNFNLVDDCFTTNNNIAPVQQKTVINSNENKQHIKDNTRIQNKIYRRCELARELKFVHNIPAEQIPIWVCIAKHESSFNTSAIGRLNYDGSEDHGLFQISDIYWCSPPGKGWVCGLSCDKLEDSDISDDVECMKTIYAEHQRLTGDGFTAWSVYKPYCQYRSNEYIDGCFEENELYSEINQIVTTEKIISFVSAGKVYSKCELALELRDKHKMPMEQIPTWVCIAYHESRYNTSAVGRLNADGSADHGIFQISDIYWCSLKDKGKACGISCADLENSDITDDVQCMKRIYEEHQRLSGNGFNAWSVYKPYCSHSAKFTTDCFVTDDDQNFIPNRRPAIIAPEREPQKSTKFIETGKIYEKCELAQDLFYKHNVPMEQISTWVCIAKHESIFNTAAVGRLNSDGSADHGLFQISDLYWCSLEGKGKACGLSCLDLEDSDITDDVICIKQIYEEHQRLSGNGFNAWTVYKPHCSKLNSKYTASCFDEIDNIINNERRPAIIAPRPPYSSHNSEEHAMTDINNEFDNEIFSVYKQSATSETPYVTENRQILDSQKIGKVYDRCNLAKELKYRHNILEEQISTWICIVQHESQFNTSTVKYGAHGLFQISEMYWCSPPGEGGACGLSCADLENDDITDDVECIKKIYEEHKRLSGNGFNAWIMYKPYCEHRSDIYVKGCFDKSEAITEKHVSTSKAIRTTFNPAYMSTPKPNDLTTTYYPINEIYLNAVTYTTNSATETTTKTTLENSNEKILTTTMLPKMDTMHFVTSQKSTTKLSNSSSLYTAQPSVYSTQKKTTPFTKIAETKLNTKGITTPLKTSKMPTFYTQAAPVASRTTYLSKTTNQRAKSTATSTVVPKSVKSSTTKPKMTVTSSERTPPSFTQALKISTTKLPTTSLFDFYLKGFPTRKPISYFTLSDFGNRKSIFKPTTTVMPFTATASHSFSTESTTHTAFKKVATKMLSTTSNNITFDKAIAYPNQFLELQKEKFANQVKSATLPLSAQPKMTTKFPPFTLSLHQKSLKNTTPKSITENPTYSIRSYSQLLTTSTATPIKLTATQYSDQRPKLSSINLHTLPSPTIIPTPCTNYEKCSQHTTINPHKIQTTPPISSSVSSTSVMESSSSNSKSAQFVKLTTKSQFDRIFDLFAH